MNEQKKGYMEIKKVKFWGLLVLAFFIGAMFMSVGSDSSSSTYDADKSTIKSDDKKSTTTSGTTMEKETAEVKEATPQGKVEVKSQNKKAGNSYNEIVGEVINNTNEPQDSVKVTVTYYNENEEVVATGFTYAVSMGDSPLAPNETAPFEVSSFPDEVAVATYKLDVSW
mgnify:CR=1 FL=1